jgi:hypothetical protein
MILTLAALLVTALAVTATAAQGAECEPKATCFGLESVSASLSSTQPGVPATQAGAHPDVTLSFAFREDPSTAPNLSGLHQSYAPLRDVRVETPAGLLGNPNVLGTSQQCKVAELVTEGSDCPNGSQVGVSKIALYSFGHLNEPLYMMVPPESSDVVARLGFIAGNAPAFINIRVRSERQDDYGLTAEIEGAPSIDYVLGVETTLWGVPASPVHDSERCTPIEVLQGCTLSAERPPGSSPIAFMTNPTRCGVPLSLTVSADSWVEPHRVVTESGEFPQITGCDKVPFNPSLFVEPTSHRAASPTGLELSFRLPAPEGVGVLESSQLRDLRIDLPPGMGVNSASADGLATCSVEQVGFGTAEPSHCPDAAKLGDTEFDIPALPRRMKGSIYLREPEPGHLFRLWVVADDLGAHIKLPGELEIDEETGQIRSVVLDIPQAPVREVRLLMKSGFRAPLVNPQSCGTYQTHWEFTPWSDTGTVGGDTPMSVNEGCNTGGFSPKLTAGSTDPAAGAFAPFLFALQREDGEQNTAAIDVSLPKGIAASFVGIPRCEGADADTGQCPAASQVGRVIASSGAGPNPLWVPQPGKDPTAVYLGGPYKGAPLSVIAVVPAQAGPFDLGDVVVKSAVYVDPVTAQATAKSDPIPQMIQGVPIPARTIEVLLDRQNFSLNPTSCAEKETTSTLTSAQGSQAHPSARYQASNCANLGFQPSLTVRLKGGTHRGSHPKLSATLRMPEGGANIAGTQVTLPLSEYVENAHFKTICTRVQFAAKQCPAESIYGTAVAHSPLFDFPLEGPVYLRSSNNPLPDLVMALHGPASMPIEVDVDGEVDSVNGRLRSTFNEIPDAPVSEFTLQMQGGNKSLIVNSANLCADTYRSKAFFSGQNGKTKLLHPALKTSCKKKQKHHKRHR